MKTIRTILATARQRLRPVSDSAASDAQLLLCDVLDVDRAYLFAHSERTLTDEEIAVYNTLVARCATGEPLPYVRGRQAWYDREFVVSPAVLIPRPETEQLLEQALAWSASRPTGHAIDVGTGSGILAVTFAAHRPDWQVTALDISPSALAIARHNATRHGVNERIAFHASDLLEAVQGAECKVQNAGQQVSGIRYQPSIMTQYTVRSTEPGTQNPELDTQHPIPNTQNPELRTANYELRTENSLLVTHHSLLVIANLPYIPTADLPDLRVSQHEPMKALDGGVDGLVLIRRLLAQAAAMWAEQTQRTAEETTNDHNGRPVGRPYKTSDMLVLLEIEARQGEVVAALAAAAFPAAEVLVLQDLAGHDRIVRVEISAH